MAKIQIAREVEELLKPASGVNVLSAQLQYYLHLSLTKQREKILQSGVNTSRSYVSRRLKQSGPKTCKPAQKLLLNSLLEKKHLSSA